jgi:LmbE family N-acetylglucosaminyl deacetylase
VVSPHCDDAVLSCGGLLAARPGATVVTVFAGDPPPGAPLTEWDVAAGFRPGDRPMAARRAEDGAALALLGARPVWLRFLDAQYGPPPPDDAVAAALERLLSGAGPRCVAVPLGLFHEDHRLVHRAALRARERHPGHDWLVYAEALYRRIPGLVDAALAGLADAGLRAAPLEPTRHSSPALKRRAVACYRSQLRALATPGRPGHADAFAPERLWRLS